MFGGQAGDCAEQLKPEQILERTLANLTSPQEISPRVRATLLDKIGAIYSSLGKIDQAKPLLNEALWGPTGQPSPIPSSPDTAVAVGHRQSEPKVGWQLPHPVA